MSTKPPNTMTETLRQAIAGSGLPMMTLAAETGVERTSLLRFARGSQTMLLDRAEKLAAYFGLELQPIDRKGKGA